MIVDHSKYSLPISFSNDEERDSVIADYIAKYKDEFPEWYMPLQLGKHTIPVRVYPTFVDQPLDDGRGIGKWDNVLKHNIPNLKHKRIADLGCSIGIFSLEMVRLGADSVRGFDRGLDMVQANNHHLGKQSVPQQAYFIRNIYEAYYQQRFTNVEFEEADLMVKSFDSDEFDIVVAFCVLYHLGAVRMEEIIEQISQHTPEVIFQANNGHGGGLGKLACRDNHVSLLKKYGYNIINIHQPTHCIQPVIYAKKDQQ